MKELTGVDITLNGNRIGNSYAFSIINNARNQHLSESMEEVLQLIRESIEHYSAVVDVFGGDPWEERHNDVLGFFGSHLVTYGGDFYLLYYYETSTERVFADNLKELEAFARLEEPDED